MKPQHLKDVVDRLLTQAVESENPTFRSLAISAGLDPTYDFVGASLRGLDLRDEDLRGFDFSHADLSGADLRRANVAGVSFKGAVLAGVVGLERRGAHSGVSFALGKNNDFYIKSSLIAEGGPDPVFARDAIDDLSQQPKRLSPKYFYDAAGSELFEAITRLPEYYPTRTELGILRDRGSEIAAIIPKGAALIEFGAGATTKVRLLLEKSAFGAYVPVDISGEFLQAQAETLRKDFPDLAFYPVAADFTTPFALPVEIAGLPKVGFFPGSTIGNFEPHEASRFLRSAREILGQGAQMIVGADLEKDERVLYDAYNDAAGVTARFNLNVLVRMNRELGGNFDLSAFTHRAIYNRERHRIEMHLISQKQQDVRMLGTSFSFRPGESIHTENSYKYSIERFAALARGAGWQVRESWTDAKAMFSVHALVAE
jgi:dimethylhistidine N-methyltransferase